MIEVKDLVFSYKRKVDLLENINLKLSNGHIHGLFGKNGVGKSTLLKLFCGLIFPQEGEIDVMGFTPKERKAEMFANLYLLAEELPESNLTMKDYTRAYSPFYPKFNKEQLLGYLNDFELPDFTKKLSNLSHGQRKKFFISFALATNVDTLFMDEPTNGLDIPSKSTFRKLVASVASEEKCVVISTHQVLDLNKLIDNVVIMENHQILVNETIDTLSKMFYFGQKKEEVEKSNIIYTESSLHGDLIVAKNSTHLDTPVDIELLFNAISYNGNEIANILNNK